MTQKPHHQTTHRKRHLVVPIVGLTMAGLLAPTGAAFANDTVAKTAFGNVAVASKSGKAVAGTKTEQYASAGRVVQSTAEHPNGWNLTTESLRGGTHEYTPKGLHIKTPADGDKSAGFVGLGTPLTLQEADDAAMDYSSVGEVAPSIQLVFYVGDKWGGTLVKENHRSDWWSTKAITGINLPSENNKPLVVSSLKELGRLADEAGLTIRVVTIGYALGTGGTGDATIRSISVAGTTYQFGVQVEAGTVAISGTPRVGQKLTAKLSDGWEPADVTIPMAYEWKADDAVLGTGATYTVKPADAGKQITVTAVGGGGQLFTAEETSAPVTVAPWSTTSLKSTNVDQQGWVFDYPRFEYQPDGLHVSSTLTEKSSGYVPMSAPLGLREAMTTASLEYTSDKGYPPGLNLTFFVDGAWGGNLVWEDVEGHWWATKSVPGAEATLQVTEPNRRYEIRDLTAFLDAVEGNTGRTVDVRALAYSLGSGVEASGVLHSIGVAGTTYEFGAQVEAGKIEISGTPQVGKQLTAAASGWKYATSTTFAWKVAGKTVGTDATYTVKPADVGKQITVTATGGAVGYEPSSKSSAAKTVAAGTFGKAPAPKVSGTAKVGVKLTAAPGSWSPNATLSYQWKADGKAIKGATKSTFTPTASQRAAKITVDVKGTASGYATTTKTSAATKAVAAGTFGKAPAPKISGSAKVGTKLTANPGVQTPSAKVSYQWKVDGKSVKGATMSTFTPRAADRGKKVTVTTKATRAGYTTVTKTSAAKKVAAGSLGKQVKPKISGTAKVGTTLRVSTGTYKVKPTSVTYQWRINGKVVKGLTGSTYRPTSKAVGGKVSVTVTAKKAGYTTVTQTTSMTPPVRR